MAVNPDASGAAPLPLGEVHVWWAELDRTLAEFDALEATLSPQERTRAARFVFERDRHRFACARGILRSILSRYLGVPPASLIIEYGPHGKPFLPGQRAADGLEFNLSHSGGIAALALVRGAAIGVDIERLDREIEIDRIASRQFAPAEAAGLARLEGAMRVRAFFAVWTRKEAFLKAVGEGLGLDLRRFEVPLAGDGAIRAPDTGDQWYTCGLPAVPGYIGALAVPGDRAPALRCYRFQM